jgi:hypothetical protein
MKKNYKLITTFIVLLSMITVKLGAQLSGLYTINSTLATGGTNYQTFNAFATAINAGGISGPVTVNVVSATGPYIEQVSFTNITGTSSTNTVTINGNGNTITFASTSGQPHVFMLAGADFFFVNNLNMVGTGFSNNLVLHLWNQANNNTISNCTITCPANITGSQNAPISLSGSATSPTSFGDCGSNNLFTGCTLNSGYYGYICYGSFTIGQVTNNQLVNCNVLDAYLYSVYNYYVTNALVSGNTIERLNRTSFTTHYGIFTNFGSSGTIIEKNKIRRMFFTNPNTSNTFFGIYLQCSNTQGTEVITRNNVISDIAFNGTFYAYYNPGYNYETVIHNTFVMDNQGSTGGTCYGIISFGQYATYRNNLVSINRTGTGTKVNLYIYYNTGVVCNNNALWNNSQQGTNSYGYDGTQFYGTFSAWQGGSYGYDANGAAADPLFANPATFDYTPTNLALNNIGAPLGVTQDINNLGRNLPAPDAGAYEFFNQPCSGTPSGNSVLTPTFVVCPAANSIVNLANTYSVNGITFAWGSSTVSALGPWTPIPTGTLGSIVTPTLPVSTWYTATISCPGFGSPLILASGQVTVAGTIISQVPYRENFEGIQGNNFLPNCSWLKPGSNINSMTYASPQNQNRVPLSGSKFASFYYFPANTSYFYTNGLQLYAGVTYSASVFFTTEYYGYTNWDLSIMVGPNQNTTGLVTVANLPVAASPAYRELANTFTVATSGIYYVAIKGTSNGNCCGAYLSWDDLSVTIPCNLNPVNMSVNATSTTICAGQPVTLTGVGANTYTWTTAGPNYNATTSAITDVPFFNTTYNVVGTNTLTNCQSSATRNVVVRPTPAVYIIPSKDNVCAGSSVNLTASGAGVTGYTWNPSGANTQVLSATPAGTPGSSVTYSVLGSNSFGCSALATQAVLINGLPTVNASSIPANNICVGGNLALNASGTAVSYQWTSSTVFNQGQNILVVVPATPSNLTYSVTGTDLNGCTSVATVNMTSFICTSIKSNVAALAGLSVYPNPTNGMFIVELVNGLNKTIEVSDVTGRTIVSANSSDDKIDMNLQTLANGIYYVTIRSNNAVEVMKIVKQ